MIRAVNKTLGYNFTWMYNVAFHEPHRALFVDMQTSRHIVYLWQQLYHVLPYQEDLQVPTAVGTI
jgi:hypothetical protein